MKRLFTIASLACSLAFAVTAALAYTYTSRAALSPLSKIIAAIGGTQ
jgi:hypothetical protein